jgi:hypothetical protein
LLRKKKPAVQQSHDLAASSLRGADFRRIHKIVLHWVTHFRALQRLNCGSQPVINCAVNDTGPADAPSQAIVSLYPLAAEYQRLRPGRDHGVRRSLTENMQDLTNAPRTLRVEPEEMESPGKRRESGCNEFS